MSLGRNFHRLWSATALSNLADGMFQVALPLLALRITRSPAEIAGLVLASRLPWLVFALHAGALADRLDRRRTMVNVDLARAVLICLLAVIAFGEAERLWILYLVAFAVPDSDVATLEDWYAAEHVPQMMTVPGWRRLQCVRVDSAVGGAFTHLALHWIDAPAVLETQARKTASLGPKRNLIAHREWFAKGGRWIYEPLLKNGPPAIG